MSGNRGKLRRHTTGLGTVLAITLVACTGTNDETRSPAEASDRGPATDLSAVELDNEGFDVGPFEGRWPIGVVGGVDDAVYFIGAAIDAGGHDVPSDGSFALDTVTGEWTTITPPPLEEALIEAEGASNSDGVFVIGRDCTPGIGELFACTAVGTDRDEITGLRYDPQADEWTTFEVPTPDVGVSEVPTPAGGAPGDGGVLYWSFPDFAGHLSAVFELDTESLEWTEREDLHGMRGICAAGDTVVGIEYGVPPRLVIAPGHDTPTVEDLPLEKPDLGPVADYRPFCTSTHITVAVPSVGSPSAEAPWLLRRIDGGPWTEVPEPAGRSSGESIMVTSNDSVFATARWIESTPAPVLAFDPAAGEWTSLEEIPLPAGRLEAITTGSGTLVVVPWRHSTERSSVIIRTAP